MFEIFVQPELERRSQKQSLKHLYPIRAFQIILDPPSPAKCLINDEVKVRLYGPIVKGLQAGDELNINSLADIEKIELTDDYPNAGHFTAIQLESSWVYSFNFRYNRRRIFVLKNRANEFLISARHALEYGHFSSFAENLFHSSELMIKAVLLSMPDKKMVCLKTHSGIQKKANLRKNGPFLQEEYVKTHNKLYGYRDKARYGDEEFILTKDEVETMYQAVEQMAEEINSLSIND